MKLRTLIIISVVFSCASTFASPVLTQVDPAVILNDHHRFFGGRFQDSGDPNRIDYWNQPPFTDANEVAAAEWGLPWAHLSYDPSTGFLSWQGVTTTENGIDLTNRVRFILMEAGEPNVLWQVNEDFQTSGSAFIGKPPNVIFVFGSSPLNIPDNGSTLLLFFVSIVVLLGLPTLKVNWSLYIN